MWRAVLRLVSFGLTRYLRSRRELAPDEDREPQQCCAEEGESTRLRNRHESTRLQNRQRRGLKNAGSPVREPCNLQVECAAGAPSQAVPHNGNTAFDGAEAACGRAIAGTSALNARPAAPTIGRPTQYISDKIYRESGLAHARVVRDRKVRRRPRYRNVWGCERIEVKRLPVTLTPRTTVAVGAGAGSHRSKAYHSVGVGSWGSKSKVGSASKPMIKSRHPVKFCLEKVFKAIDLHVANAQSNFQTEKIVTSLHCARYVLGSAPAMQS
jgi:hypothetical protein